MHPVVAACTPPGLLAPHCVPALKFFNIPWVDFEIFDGFGKLCLVKVDGVYSFDHKNLRIVKLTYQQDRTSTVCRLELCKV